MLLVSAANLFYYYPGEYNNISVYFNNNDNGYDNGYGYFVEFYLTSEHCRYNRKRIESWQTIGGMGILSDKRKKTWISSLVTSLHLMGV